MTIGLIGAGNIGGTLGQKWSAAGHRVVFGARDPNSPKTRAALARTGAAVADIPAALAEAEIAVLALPGAAVDELLAQHGRALDGKIVIDTTNNLRGAEMNAVSAIARQAPAAQVFRAFNTLGWECFAQPRFGDVAADLFYCGPDGPARTAVEGLIADVGLRPVRVGGLDQLAVVDALARLWFALALGQNRGRHTALKLLTD